MQEQEFQTLCLMTAVLRTGKAGRTDKAWGEAMREATAGYGLLVRNRETLAQIVALQSAEPPQSAEVPQTTVVAEST